MATPINYEEFKRRLTEKTNTIIDVGEYKGWRKPMEFKCLVCGNEWTANEAGFFVWSKYFCPKCAEQKRKENARAALKRRRKSEEQFREELAEVHPNLIPNDTYKNVNTKYHCICKIHNCDVYKTPSKYLNRKQGCNLCVEERLNRVLSHTDKTFKEKAYSLNKDIEILSEYKNNKDKVLVHCKICGYEWRPQAVTLIKKNPYGCPKCAGNAIKTPEEFEKSIKHSHPEITLLSPYVRSHIKLHALCNNCGNDFYIKPSKLLSGQHCPNCNRSNGERVLKSILEDMRIEYIHEKTFEGLNGVGGQRLRYDFYLPKQNLLIEYQGAQHEKPVVFKGETKEQAEQKFKTQIEHDNRKRNFAKLHNIELLEIWYKDFDQIEEILTQKLNDIAQKVS